MCYFRLKEFSEEGIQPLMDFFELVNNLVYPEPPEDPQIVKSSVFGNHWFKLNVLGILHYGENI